MNTNIPAIAAVYADLESVLAKLQAISAEQIESHNLVPRVKAVQSIGAYAAAIVAQINNNTIKMLEVQFIEDTRNITTGAVVIAVFLLLPFKIQIK